jgi:catechol 2,3-dioxygenase-like lactoylglutathione lyase family enzyme
MIKKIEDNGGRIFSDRAEGALKYFAADGTLGEIVAAGRYPVKERSKLSRISNVSYNVKDLDKAVAFYKNVFEFDEVPSAKAGQRILTDGQTTLTLNEGGDRPAITSWGLSVANLTAIAEQVKQRGGALVAGGTGGIQYFRGPDGNLGELIKTA